MKKKRFRLIVATILSVSCFAVPSSAGAEDNPEFRPALVGNGPDSLVNQIDLNRLAQEGQGDGVIMFSALVTQTGYCFPRMVYRGTPGTDALQKEVFRALTHARFIPAIFHRKPEGVEFRGAVMFFAGPGKPRLKVFASQNPEELAHEKDFVAPQLLAGTDNWKYSGEEVKAAVLRGKNGAADLALHVDARGKLLDCKVVREDPPGYHFGEASCHALQPGQYVPGFRNGKPAECTFRFTSLIQTQRRAFR